MAGLFLGIWAALKGVAAVHDGIDTVKRKSDPYYLPNGVPYYIDQRGAFRLLDGTMIVGNHWIMREYESGKIVYDRSAEDRKKSLAQGKKFSKRYSKRCRQDVWFDDTTDKQIAKLERNEIKENGEIVGYECRMYYWYDKVLEENRDKVRDWVRRTGTKGVDDYLHCIGYTHPNDIRPGDNGVKITDEEFDSIASKVFFNRSHIYNSEIEIVDIKLFYKNMKLYGKRW